MRLPGDDRDLRARLVALEGRATSHRMPPRLDGAGRLHYQGRLLPLATEEAALARALATRFGAVVSDTELAVALGDHAGLRQHMTHLRSRLRPFGLLVRRAPRRGYALQDR